MQTVSPALYVIIAAVVVIAIVVFAIAAARRSASARLANRFGSEYDRVVRARGDRGEAERELTAREQRVKKLHIEELPAGARARYTEEWRTVQERFVDQPKGAIDEADRLVGSVMRDRGYPVDNFEQQVADISPDHPSVVEHYRAAHDIAVRSEQGEVTTEDLREAMLHYRTLFTDLVGVERNKQ